MPCNALLSQDSDDVDGHPESRVARTPTAFVRPWDLQKLPDEDLAGFAIIPVSMKKNIPPENKPIRKIGFRSTKSGDGEQFLQLDYMAEARTKGLFFHRHR